MEHVVTDAMRRYREGLASRGVRQIQANMPDAMVDWIDQFALEKGLNRSAMIEVLCRLGAAKLDHALFEESTQPPHSPDAETDAPTSEVRNEVESSHSMMRGAPPGSGQFSRFLGPALRSCGDAHLLLISSSPSEGRATLDRLGPAIVCDWQGASPVQGQR